MVTTNAVSMFLGIEIGGTKLQLGVGDGNGPPLAELVRVDVDARRGADAIRREIERVGRELAARHSIHAVGFGFGGPVDAARGRVVKSHQVAGWDDFPLVDWTSQLFGLPVVLGNDCDAAALAEARFGAGRGKRAVFYVTVGTGVGGGLVVDGQLYRGGGSIAAEIGHLRPGLDATAPDSTVEAAVAGPGIARAAQSLPAVDVESHHRDLSDLLARCGGDWERLNGQHVAEAAGSGNRRALAALDRACRTLGWAIAQVVTLAAPNVVVLGGGVSLMLPELFLIPVQRYAWQYVFPPLREAFRIVSPVLGEKVVVHGAIALAATP